MTFDQIADMGKRMLAEYQERLNVHGTRKFDHTARKIAHHLECSNLIDVPDEEVESLIRGVLERLVAAGDFIMSEPEVTPPILGGGEIRNVEHGDLRMTFTYAGNAQNASAYLWISCQYFPAR